MTEAEWRVCTNPEDMRRNLPPSSITERRLLRLTLAFWKRTITPGEARLLNAMDRYADGKLSRFALDEAYVADEFYGGAPFDVFDVPDAEFHLSAKLAKGGVPFELCQLFHDIFGNPFRPVAFATSWRTEHSVGLAARMYDDREFAAMPILADAIEEAGCDNADILFHCRESGVHVRGCWVVDLVLGKA